MHLDKGAVGTGHLVLAACLLLGEVADRVVAALPHLVEARAAAAPALRALQGGLCRRVSVVFGMEARDRPPAPVERPLRQLDCVVDADEEGGLIEEGRLIAA